jgi:signal peptidase I
MRKAAIIFAVIGVLFWIGVALRLTHILEYYTVGSIANFPTLPLHKIVFASKLKKPGYNSFVCFKDTGQRYVSISRVIGQAGDTIEIKNAKVYRNGKLLDEPFTCFSYEIHRSQVDRIKKHIGKSNNLTPLGDSTYSITLSTSEVKTYHLNLIPTTLPKGAVSDEEDQLFEAFKLKGYNADNIGPIKVPAGSYFLLGDNRDLAYDSRSIGFVKTEQVVSTLFDY